MQSFFAPFGGLIGNLITPLVALFPDADTNAISFISNGVTMINDYLSYANAIFPISDFIFFFKFAIALEITIFTIRTFLWIASILTFGVVKKF